MTGRGAETASVATALEMVQSRAAAEDAVVITGSLVLVGEARAYFQKGTRQGWAA